MPRPTKKHVKHVGSATIVLDKIERARLAAVLVNRGLATDSAARFADGANRAAVYAYELEPKMSTSGESRRAHQAALKAVDQKDYRRVRELLNESTDEFDGRWHLECELLADTGRLTAALSNYRAHCEAELAVLRRGDRRKPTKRQLLAEGLVREWLRAFDGYPPYRDGSDKTFLHILKDVILRAEATYLRGVRRAGITHEVLRNLTKRACEKVRRRVRQESQVSSRIHGSE